MTDQPGLTQIDAALRELVQAKRLALALAVGAVALAALLVLGFGRSVTPSRALAAPQHPPYVQPVSPPTMAGRPAG